MVDEPRIGFFICHCGINIADKVDVKRVVEYAKTLPNVVYATDNMFMCSTAGNDLIRDAIKRYNLNRTVVASCSVEQHGPTFMRILEEENINPYFHEQANVREQVSWVTEDREEATKKAISVVRGAVARANNLERIDRKRIPVEKSALVIGAGVAGLNAAIDIAESDISVHLVEKTPSIGGHMTMLNKTFPTDECPMCSISPLLNAVNINSNIKLHIYSEVIDVSGTLGEFYVKIRKMPRYVDEEKCTSCGLCADHCPVELYNEWDRKFGVRKAIYKPFPQAIPSVYTIDDKHCIRCGACIDVCEPNAIDFDQTEEIIEVKVGSIVVATGYDEYDPAVIEEYGYGEYPNVITQLDFERIVSPTSITGGRILSPSDGKIPKEIVVIQCVGSRDEQIGKNPYCTGVCCMYGIKNAKIAKDQIKDGNVTMCYIDIRSPGLLYEEYYKDAQERGINFIRGKPSEIIEDPITRELTVKVEDTFMGKMLELPADLIILSAGMVAPKGVGRISSKLGILRGKEGFFKEQHIKMAPVNSSKAGVFLAGTAQGPKDITTSVAHGKGAASAASILLSRGYIDKDLLTAVVDLNLCIGCRFCEPACSYGAIQMKDGKAEVNEISCGGCGTCVPSCPTGAIQIRGFRDEQIVPQIREVLREV